ncbi:cag pathogenicity island Cag12 family protein [Pseudomonas savastanoi]|nr:cag pathogenicity island Cag12 family protein [Pseudomonas savastanoi]
MLTFEDHPMKKIAFCFLSVAGWVLGGCSSPPQPVAVDFEQQPEVVNTGLPRLVVTHEVIKSAQANGPWSLTLADFQGDQRSYDTAFYYALAHADLIELDTHNLADAARTQQWLLQHGATAPIRVNQKATPVQPVSRTWKHETTSSSLTYRATTLCVGCENVSITLHKYGEVQK